MQTIEIDAYVVDTLMRDLVGHDRQPSAFLVYLYLWRRAAEAGNGGGEREGRGGDAGTADGAVRHDAGDRGDPGERGERCGVVVASLRDIAGDTGLSRRAVQGALARLHRRKLIGIRRASITAVPEYTVERPWARGRE